jgi:hypothetical protein
MRRPLFAALALATALPAEEAGLRPDGVGEAVAAGVAAEGPEVVEPPPVVFAAPAEVISRSGQFRVSGGDAFSRGTIAILADEARDSLVRLMGEGGGREIPVVVTLHGREGDPLPARTHVLEPLIFETGYELRLRVHLARGVERERLRRAATVALLYERGLRRLPPAEAGDTLLRIPAWITEGLMEARDWEERTSDRRLYEVLYQRGGLYTLDQLFAVDEAAQENMDAAMRAAFRVSAGSLVMALLEQPQGKEAFRSFVGEVAPFDGEMPVLLRKHFPELNLSEDSLAKWWALQMANKGTLDLGEVHTISRTEELLGQALKLHLKDEEGLPLEVPLTAEIPDLPLVELVAAVRPAQDALVRLSYRCFPSYRPLLVDYQAILGDIALGRTKGLAARLESLGQARELMIGKAGHARDFLDWFEITRARETSGAFDDYLRLKDQLRYNPRRRTDDLSGYLDRLDRVFHRESDAGMPAAAASAGFPLPP